MQTNYATEAATVISRLEQAGYSESIIASHRRCYDSLQSYFSARGSEFSVDEAVKWLEDHKNGWSYGTYCQYRSALFRFERYLHSGSIVRTMCWSVDDFACRDTALTLPVQLRETYYEFRSALMEKFNQTDAYYYSKGCKDFLLFIADLGCTNTTKLTIDPIIEYVCKLYGTKRRLYGEKTRWLAGIVNLLVYLAERGDIPYCYSAVLPRNTATHKLLPLRLQAPGNAFQPSKALEAFVPGYLESLDEMCYAASSKQLYINDFTNFFMFLELNHIEYSETVVELWLTKHPSRGTIWERKRHTLALFGHYLKTGSSNRAGLYTWQPLQIDRLPNWSRNIILGFIEERRREGGSPKTLTMCRSGGYRLFSFLEGKGIDRPDKITPELIKEFHNTDRHSTPESKNAYSIKVRQLLSYMADLNLAPKNLYLSVSTQCAPRRSIVNVMSGEMVSAVYDYRTKASEPLELRDAAIVMLGLRMGLRASDIVNLKVDDFDWSKKTLSIVQQKTRKAITLPVPVDAGNSVYKYVMGGRPRSGVGGAGYVFVRHLAPFGNVTRQVCRDALKRIMSEYGLELLSGEGFHITRRTFATSLLAAKVTLDGVSNALGHERPETSEVYLARDEENMRLCPLPFESVGVV